MNQIYRGILRETTQEVLYEMGRANEMYYGTAIQYMGRYLWKLEDYMPEKDIRIWDMFQGHPQEYFTAIRIRDAAISVGGTQNELPYMEKREKTTPYWNTSNECNCSTTKKEISKESS